MQQLLRRRQVALLLPVMDGLRSALLPHVHIVHERSVAQPCRPEITGYEHSARRQHRDTGAQQPPGRSSGIDPAEDARSQRDQQHIARRTALCQNDDDHHHHSAEDIQQPLPKPPRTLRSADAEHGAAHARHAGDVVVEAAAQVHPAIDAKAEIPHVSSEYLHRRRAIQQRPAIDQRKQAKHRARPVKQPFPARRALVPQRNVDAKEDHRIAACSIDVVECQPKAINERHRHPDKQHEKDGRIHRHRRILPARELRKCQRHPPRHQDKAKKLCHRILIPGQRCHLQHAGKQESRKNEQACVRDSPRHRTARYSRHAVHLFLHQIDSS